MSGKKSPGNNSKYLKIFWVVIILPLVMLFAFVGSVAMGLFGELPSFDDLENPNSALASEVFSVDDVLLGKYYFQNRTNVHYKELAPNLVNALKATEDIRFEEHSGIDIKGLLRVLFKTVILRQSGSGGGSTITQQLAKNLFPANKSMDLKLLFEKYRSGSLLFA